MSAIIVALSNSEVTTRALVVFVLAMIAIFLVAKRPIGGGRGPSNSPAGSNHGGSNQNPRPLFVRVDQRTQPLYEPPQPSRRIVSSGSLLAAVAVGGAVVAFVIAYVISALVGSVTSLLR
jgi:hypothetical protein